MTAQKKAPRTVNAEGQTNSINYMPNPADADPAHPANLCPAVAEHLLLAAFGEAFGGVAVQTAREAQKLSLTIVLRVAGCSHGPVLAWRAASMAAADGRMLATYARLSGDAVVVGDARECHDLTIDASDARLGVVQDPPLPGTVAFNEMAVAVHLHDFARHAREFEYDAAMIVRLADEVDPPLPMVSWSDVARALGVVA